MLDILLATSHAGLILCSTQNTNTKFQSYIPVPSWFTNNHNTGGSQIVRWMSIIILYFSDSDHSYWLHNIHVVLSCTNPNFLKCGLISWRGVNSSTKIAAHWGVWIGKPSSNMTNCVTAYFQRYRSTCSDILGFASSEKFQIVKNVSLKIRSCGVTLINFVNVSYCF